MKKIKIGIADDHPVIGQGISLLLKNIPGMDVMFIVNDQQLLFDQLHLQPVDILLLDVVMPGVSGIDLFVAVAKKFPAVKMVAFTSLNNAVLIKNLYRQQGVKAYVNKNNDINELLNIIKIVHEGNIYVPPGYEHLVELKTEEQKQDISPREKEVLLLIAQQYTTNQIAEKLFISVNTVESHRKKLLEKFQVENLAGLIKQAIEQGYIH